MEDLETLRLLAKLVPEFCMEMDEDGVRQCAFDLILVCVCCSVLQCVAVRCSVLQCVAVRCSVFSGVVHGHV